MAPYNNSGVFAVGSWHPDIGFTTESRIVLIRNPYWGPTWDGFVASNPPPGPLPMYEFIIAYQERPTNYNPPLLRFYGGPSWYDGQFYHFPNYTYVSATAYGL